VRTLTIRYADAPMGMKHWAPFYKDQLKRAGFDLDGKVSIEIARDHKSILVYQIVTPLVTLDDILAKLTEIEKILNVGA
jgi:hypothetical protein